MDDMKIFVPITKIDAAQRLVYGVVTAERPDGSGEVCDYASTKPFYQKWSQNFASATDGRSSRQPARHALKRCRGKTRRNRVQR